MIGNRHDINYPERLNASFVTGNLAALYRIPGILSGKKAASRKNPFG